MANAVRFYEAGGPEVLRYEEVAVGEPGPGEVRVRHVAVGLNFADTYFRLGYYPVPLPNGMGVEASGVIEAVGPDVTGFAVGDRVTYTGSPLGAYSTERVMPTGSLFKLPDGISHEVGRRVDHARPQRRLLAAEDQSVDEGGRHHPAARRGRRRRADRRPMGQAARPSRHRHRVDRGKGGNRQRRMAATRSSSTAARMLPERVMELTGGEGVTTVYDTVGKDTFAGSLKSLKRRGVLVGCGTASGPFPPIDALQLAIQGSVYFTRPALADYIADPAERAELSGALFDHIASGRIKIEINQRYALEDAVQAHRDLEAGKTTGSSIFVI